MVTTVEGMKGLFDDLVEIQREGSVWPVVELCGVLWDRCHTGYLNQIVFKDGNKKITIVDRGEADVSVYFNIGHGEIIWQNRNFETLLEACQYGLSLGCEMRDAAGVVWHRIMGEHSSWRAAFSKGDTGKLFKHDGGDYSIERELCRNNEYFSVRYHGSNYDGKDCRMLDFEIAASKCALVFAGLEWMRASIAPCKEDGVQS